MTLPKRLAKIQSGVNVQIDDLVIIRRHVHGKRQVRVNMNGLACGPHVVVARRFKIRPTVRIWSVTSAKGITRQLVQF